MEEMNPLFYDTVFSIARRGIGWMDGKQRKYIYKMMWTKIFYSHVITLCFFRTY